MELNRAGNPLQIYWDFTLRMQDGSAKDFSLEGKSLNLTLITPRGKKSIEDYHVSGNVIDWLFSADYQTTYGDHSLMLEVLAPSGKVISTSTQYNFVRIIDESCLDDETEEGLDNVLLDEGDSVVLLSTVLHALRIMPVYPEVGPNGNWWVDGVDTGKPSAGMSAYEFAKENGYTGTEAEYAAECAAMPTLNEESRVATAAASEAAGNANRAAGEARRSATMANSAAENANEAAREAEKAINNLSDVATSGDYSDLKNKPVIPTKTSQLINDNGLVDEQTLNTALEDFNKAVDALSKDVNTLTGTGEGSVIDIVNKEVAKVIDSAPETMDTLKEIADLIENDAEQAADILATLGAHEARIDALENRIVVMSETEYANLTNKEDKFYFCYEE